MLPLLRLIFVIVFYACSNPAQPRLDMDFPTERYDGAKYVGRVLEASRLNMPLMLLTDGYGNESFQQVGGLGRNIPIFIQRSPTKGLKRFRYVPSECQPVRITLLFERTCLLVGGASKRTHCM